MIEEVQKKRLTKSNTHSFMIKTLSKLGIYGNFLNLTKDICKNPAANIIPNGETLGALPLRSGTTIKIILEFQAIAIRQENEIKGIYIGKEEIKLSFFAHDTIMYVENPKEYTKISWNY